MYREQTKVIKIGDRVIGGGNPILIQSMTNTKTEDVEATVAQILRLEQAGCEIIRIIRFLRQNLMRFNTHHHIGRLDADDQIVKNTWIAKRRHRSSFLSDLRQDKN